MLVPRLLRSQHCTFSLAVLPIRMSPLASVPQVKSTPSPSWSSQFPMRNYQTLQSQNLSQFSCKRSLFTSPPLLCVPSSGEQAIIAALAKSFPNATDIAVVDISGGCGSMFEVFIEAPDFRGVRLVKQHQLVTKALKAEIGEMHGIRIATQATPGCGGS